MTNTPRPDYQTLIDPETWAFIRDTERWYPPETASYPIERQRQIYDDMCRAFHKGYPPGVSARDMPFGEVPCRVYERTDAEPGTVIYLHGGGSVVGGLHSHDDVCAEICAATGARVVASDYRLAPEHLHPAQFEDAVAVTQAVAATFAGPLVLAGDSAGGRLAATVAHAVRGVGPAIAGQVLIYPDLGGDADTGSYMFHSDAPMLTRGDALYYRRVRHGDGTDLSGDVTAQPLNDPDLSGLPPTIVLSAECDPLADDGPAYAAAIVAAGDKAHARVEAGLVHGYLRARHSSARARASFARITAAIAAFAQGGWPDWAES